MRRQSSSTPTPITGEKPLLPSRRGARQHLSGTKSDLGTAPPTPRPWLRPDPENGRQVRRGAPHGERAKPRAVRKVLVADFTRLALKAQQEGRLPQGVEDIPAAVRALADLEPALLRRLSLSLLQIEIMLEEGFVTKGKSARIVPIPLYQEAFLLAYRLFMNEARARDICGLDYITLHRWKNEPPSGSDFPMRFLLAERDVADRMMENDLIRIFHPEARKDPGAATLSIFQQKGQSPRRYRDNFIPPEADTLQASLNYQGPDPYAHAVVVGVESPSPSPSPSPQLADGTLDADAAEDVDADAEE